MPNHPDDLAFSARVSEIDIEIGRQARAIRQQQQLSLNFVAEALGIAPTTYDKLEHGQLRFGPQILGQLADILGVPLSGLFERVRANCSDRRKPSNDNDNDGEIPLDEEA